MARTPLLVAVLLALLVSACSGDDAAIPAGTTTTLPSKTSVTSDNATTTTRAAASVEADITQRYEAFWDERFAANQAPVDPAKAGLREFATGAQLNEVIAETTRNRDEGIAFRRPKDTVYKRRVHVISVEGDVARVQDCVTNDGIVYRVASGEVVDDKVATNSLEAVMRRVDGVWKLESTKLLQRWDGVSGCALAG